MSTNGLTSTRPYPYFVPRTNTPEASKVPLYRKALRAFVEREVCPTPSDLGAEFGLHPLGIQHCITKQDWVAARLLFQAQRMALHNQDVAELARQVNGQMRIAWQDCTKIMVPALTSIVDAVASLPIESTRAKGKKSVTLARSKVELLRQCANAMTDISKACRALGLLAPDDKDGRPVIPEMVNLDAQMQVAIATSGAKPEDPIPDEAMEFVIETDKSDPLSTSYETADDIPAGLNEGQSGKSL